MFSKQQQAPKKKEPEPEEEAKRLLFDVAHNESMSLDTDEYKDFKAFLAKNNFEVWKLSMKPITYDLVKDYSVLFIGAPKNDKFDENEVVEIMKYLREGGALILVSESGGDQYNNTNLNLIADQLGFQFNADFLAHEEDYEGDDFYDTIVRGVGMNPITMGVRSLYTGPTCTIKIIDESGAKSLAYSHEPYPESRHVAVHGYYALGRFFACSIPLLQKIKRHDNEFFLQSVFYWLTQLRSESEFL
ncbi:MAG: hypothetical protein ACTSU5_12010 [Promethearchaeota archaeon]